MKSEPRPESSAVESYRGFYKVIAPLIMGSGVGDGQTTACVMAQAACIDALRKGKTLEKPTDEMECACPVLRRIAIRLNDTEWWKSNEERTEILRPIIPLLLDSRGDKKLTDKRVFFAADHAVRDLTPIRLEYIAAHTKNDKVKSDCFAGAKTLRKLERIEDKKTALEARDVCANLHAYAYAYASAYASAYADAYADASADASADAYADASADASASASADASASAYAYADAYAYAYADASASASAYAQKLRYRSLLLKLFHDLAALK